MDSWCWAQMCAVLEPNINAQRLPFLSHLLLSPMYTFVQNCSVSRAVSNRESRYPLGVTFSNAVSKLKAQSPNVSFHWNVAKEMFELWALSFRKCHPEWDWLECTGISYWGLWRKLQQLETKGYQAECNRRDIKSILWAFVFVSGLSPYELRVNCPRVPTPPLFTLQLFLDFRTIFSGCGPLFFVSTRFTR